MTCTYEDELEKGKLTYGEASRYKGKSYNPVEYVGARKQ